MTIHGILREILQSAILKAYRYIIKETNHVKCEIDEINFWLMN